MKCPAGNAQIVGIHLKPMPTPTRVHPARKNANFWTTPATHRIVRQKAPTIGSRVPKNKNFFYEIGYIHSLQA
jgi:hypothetical protein